MRGLYFIVIFVFTICKSHAQQSLTAGVYHVDIQKTLALMEEEKKHEYEALENNARVRADQSLADRVFIFKEVGYIEVRWKVKGIDKSVTGAWVLIDEDKLHITIDNQTTEYGISWPTSTGLLLKSSKPAGFFGTLYLERSK